MQFTVDGADLHKLRQIEACLAVWSKLARRVQIALAHLKCTGKGPHTGILFLSIGNENIRVCRVLELGSGVARVLVKF